MSRTIGWFWLVAAGVAFVAAGCIDDHEAEECQYLGTCPPADAGSPGNACSGQCVPGNVSLYSPGDPWLVWMGEQPPPDGICPKEAPNDAYDGVAPPPAPLCGGCTCEPSTGSCALPVSATAHADDCPGTGTGTAFDAPTAWDGSCTTEDAIPGGVQSLTVAPLVRVDNGCVPKMVVAKGLPTSWQHVHACGGTANGDCASPADVCVPNPPPSPWGEKTTWTYCVPSSAGPCPIEYPSPYTFALSYTGVPSCSPCTCGPSAGSDCTSLVSVYADDACSDPIGAVTASSTASKCDDMPVNSPLGSKSASPPVYQAGSCQPAGGSVTGTSVPTGEVTLCCLD